jgi:hypothetical protein
MFRGVLRRAKRRYLDILSSIYIYNEHRGYSSLDRVLAAVRARYPEDARFIQEVEKHRSDERKHYLMFKRYFENRGEKPYAVDRTCGHIDRLIKMTCGCHIDELDTGEVVSNPELFNKICRIIMITEQRGVRMVDVLLRSSIVAADHSLLKIFRVVERDEPSHWMPYDAWLKKHQGGKPRWSERLSDFWVHVSLVTTKVPLLFLNPKLPRMAGWYDDQETAPRARRRDALASLAGRASGCPHAQLAGQEQPCPPNPALRAESEIMSLLPRRSFAPHGAKGSAQEPRGSALEFGVSAQVPAPVQALSQT